MVLLSLQVLYALSQTNKIYAGRGRGRGGLKSKSPLVLSLTLESLFVNKRRKILQLSLLSQKSFNIFLLAGRKSLQRNFWTLSLLELLTQKNTVRFKENFARNIAIYPVLS